MPGADEHRLRSALSSDAHAVVADFEDAVAPDAKAAARDIVARVFSEQTSTCLRLVRVNRAGSVFFADDLAAVARLPLDALVLPKATPDAVRVLGTDGAPVIAIIETAEGLLRSYEVAKSSRVAALLLGGVDLAAELLLEARPDGQELLYARSKLVVDSAAAGVRAPFDVAYVDTRDERGLEAETRHARSLGLRGKTCIHPAQVPIVNHIFNVTSTEVQWAQRVIEAHAKAQSEGLGVTSLDGTMVDLAVVARAKRILGLPEGGTYEA